ncbi:hypothetical protein MNBD_GAMMA12-3008 [hydrothermal vent metagenome]|uniref:HDOD domain-containing protein n=1 Tax=hydrothermal vent metagenome TaxID=652676 RepID=A0A3B0Y8Y9_9ZZZZ
MDVRQLMMLKIKDDYTAGKLKVPSLPEVAFRIREAIQDENKSAFQIAKIIQLDPVLATRLIQVANSPLYRGNKEIEECHSAISRLGMKTSRTLVTSFAIQQVYGAKHPKVRKALKLNWRHSSQVAAISYVLGRVTPGIQPDRALLGGLVHDIGVLPVLRYSEDYPEVLNDSVSFAAMLRKVAPGLGRLVLKAWGMKEDLWQIPEQVYNWNYQASGEINYVDMVIVAHIHCSQGYHEPVEAPAVDEVESFRKLPIAKFGKDAGLELVQGAQDEISEIMRMIVE